jgi:hypothetical protein
LEAQGYSIPKLLVERDKSESTDLSEGFELPVKVHDIYEETTFQEFRDILSRITTGKMVEPSYIRFKLDFQAVWVGLQ